MLSSLLPHNEWAVTFDVLTRFLSFTNFVAMLSFSSLVPGLISSQGISPVSKTVNEVLGGEDNEDATALSFRNKLKLLHEFPSLFLFSSSDTTLFACCIIGCVCGALGTLGFYPALMIAVCTVTKQRFLPLTHSPVLPWHLLRLRAMCALHAFFLFCFCVLLLFGLMLRLPTAR